MNSKKCKDCYYGNVCPRVAVCSEFTPITNEAEDMIIDEIIEKNRKIYHTEWNTYINEWM